jgi:DNA invertase Pin-like site-specific DNA recombinase
MDQKKAELARKLYKDDTNTIDDILKILNIGKTTFYRYVRPKDKEEKE